MIRPKDGRRICVTVRPSHTGHHTGSVSGFIKLFLLASDSGFRAYVEIDLDILWRRLPAPQPLRLSFLSCSRVFSYISDLFFMYIRRTKIDYIIDVN